MCTLCRGVLCTEPLTPIQGVNLLHLHWVMFWYSEMGKGDPWKLKAAIPQGELTIMARVSFQISSIESAAQYAEYQMVRTKLPQIFPFNPLGPTAAHRGHWAVFIFHINLWLCQIDGLKSFFGTLILLQGKWFSISIWCMTQNICVAADFHDVPLWWHELFQHLQRFYKVSNWRFVIVSVFVSLLLR